MTTPQRERTNSNRGVLQVEWIDGPEARGGTDPKVLVDGTIVGVVDSNLHLAPGVRWVCVQRGWLKTRQVSVGIYSGKKTVLVYKSGPTLWALYGIAGFAVSAVVAYFFRGETSNGLVDIVTLVSIGGVWLALLGIASALQVILESHGITIFAEGELDISSATNDSDIVAHTVEVAQHEVGHSQPRCGRLVVNLVVSSQYGVQPPRPKVVLDGKSLGTAANMYRIPAGSHSLQVKGWFDRSNVLPVCVPAGELLEVECEFSGRGIITAAVIGICAAAALVSTLHFQLYDWCSTIIVGVIIISGVVAHVISRYSTTLELSLGS